MVRRKLKQQCVIIIIFFYFFLNLKIELVVFVCITEIYVNLIRIYV